MKEDAFRPPEEAAMRRLLREYGREPTGIILCLAWLEGLTRKEISDLTWEQVDFENRLLRLPDREVPLDAEAAEMLAAWEHRCRRFGGGYVAVSDRLRKRLASQSITTLARNALDRAGQTEVRLQDLRQDFIRRQLAIHDWPYVLRITGVALSTYRAGLYRLAEQKPDAQPETPPQGDDPGEDFKLWRVLQAERGSPAGIALWLSSQQGLQCEEIVRLTWNDVDFEKGTLRLPDRSVPLTVGVRNVLKEEYARRGPEEDPHVILTPRSRGPMEPSRLTTVVRSALIRGGIENRTMQDFRRDTAWEAQRDRLRAYLSEHDGITRMEASELLGLSMGQVYSRLTKLTEAGELVLLGSRYYPAEAAVAPDRREEAIIHYINENGGIARRDAERLLRVGRHKATELLNAMTAAGTIAPVPGTWRYRLAEGYNSIIERQADIKESTDSEPFVAVSSQIARKA